MTVENETQQMSDMDLVSCTADIVNAYVGRNSIAASALPELIRSVHGALAGSAEVPAAPAERQKPAVPVSRSVQRDHIVCLEDGAQLKMLKRYLRSHFDMSPEDYRRKWNLAPDYPMVAPAYAERRSELAKSIGLGRGVRRRD
ncbi:MAG: MucR family transcriptional regulator [Caulobacter sp.]|nr:MucR family transcriptional regulator [Caulobacter sp.]